MAPPEEERAERLRLEATLYELERVEPWGAVTAESLAALKERCRRRLAYLALAPGERRKAASAAGPAAEATPELAGQAPPLSAAGTAAVSPAPIMRAPAPPGPGLREFLAERSILIVSYVGAFLLIVATLLFELAAETFGGPVRFAGVLALDLVFGAAAWLCRRSPRLRIVGTTYLAIFALIAPLVFVAAYVFLVLREQGVSVSLMVTVGALSCAALYGTLAAGLRSAGYAVLSALAVLAAWCGALVAIGLGEWGGAGLTPLPVFFTLLAFGLRGGERSGERDGERGTRRPPRAWLALPPAAAETFIHATAALALAWTTLSTLEGLLTGSPDAADRWAMTLTLAGVALGYAAYGWLAARRWVTPLAAALTSLGVLAATAALETDWWVPSLALLALAWVYAALAGWLPVGRERWVRPALRALAALQAAVCALVPATPDALQAAIVVAAAALGVFLAWSSNRTGATGAARGAHWWLAYAAALFSLGWYWLVKVVVPPPERPAFLGLLTAYAPLPVLMAGAALAVSRWCGVRWALSVYVVAALNAAWVGVGLVTERESMVPGWTYLAYGAGIYALAWAERYPGGAPALAVLAAAGVASLLRAYALPVDWWPLILAPIAWLVYALGHVRSRTAWEEHRWSALALAGLVALGCFGVPSFLDAGQLGALTSLGALLSCAALLALDGLRRSGDDGAYERAGAVFLVAAGSFWVARYVGLEDAQRYVALPGLALLWDGYALRRRDRSVSRAFSGVGLTLLLGTTALQMVDGDSEDELSIAVLVAESVAALLAGVALRQRVYVLFGAGGAALAALRALLMLLAQVPLFVVFGIAALLLLGLAALLAFLRERLGRATTTAGWSDWD